MEKTLILWNNNDLFAGGLIVRYAHTRLHKGGIEIAKINLQAVRFVRFLPQALEETRCWQKLAL